MKLKLADVVQINALFQPFLKENLPITTAYKIAKFCKSVENDVEFYMNQINQIIAKYAFVDDNGELKYTDAGGVKIKEESIQECGQELEELYNQIVEISTPQFQITDLEKLNLTPNDLMLLMPFIEA